MDYSLKVSILKIKTVRQFKNYEYALIKAHNAETNKIFYSVFDGFLHRLPEIICGMLNYLASITKIFFHAI
jgi:hypothetical protein